MRGWVYVITNRAMPGLVKIGYSMKDPDIRAEELNHTGSPHPYEVEYELLIDEPRDLERQVHRRLSSKREGKEWFRCSPEEATAIIKLIAGKREIHETFKRADREKAEAIRSEKDRQSRKREELFKLESDIESRLRSEEDTIREKYRQQFEMRFPPKPRWQFGLICAIPVLIITAALGSPLPIIILLTLFLGSVLGSLLTDSAENRTMQSEGYRSLEEQQRIELEAVRSRIVSCNHCSQQMRVDRKKLLSRSGVWKCPSCKVEIPHVRLIQ